MSDHDANAVSKANLLQRLEQGWDKLQAYLATLTPEQLTEPTDAAGWTVKDHITHLAAWEDGVCKLLQKQPFRVAVDIDQATWGHGEDAENEIIRQRYRGWSMNEVRQHFQRVHARLLAQINAMTDDDLRLAYKEYDMETTQNVPIMEKIIGNSFGHYAEHIPWIEALVKSKQ
jgi:uncharacterized protein (TIGR03083 family)